MKGVDFNCAYKDDHVWNPNMKQPAAGFSDWEKQSFWKYMTECKLSLVDKHPNLKQYLIDTGTRPIIENSPYDSFWGCAENGKNMLGKLLMELRDSNNNSV